MPFVGTTSSGSQRHFGFTYGQKPVWTDSTLSAFRYLDAYSDSVQASGTAPITYSVISGALPSGLSLNQNTGLISGSTTATGSYNFTIQARNHLGTITQAFSMSVPQAPVGPGFVTGTYVASGGQTLSLNIASSSRQAGDLCIVTWQAYILGNATTSLGANPSGWTLIGEYGTAASVLDNGGDNPVNHTGRAQTYYRVMSNTSADNFSINLGQPEFTYLAAYLIVRPAAGMTFTPTFTYQGGQNGGPPAFPVLTNNNFQIGSIPSPSSLPRTILSTAINLSPNVNVSSGPQLSVGKYVAGPMGWPEPTNVTNMSMMWATGSWAVGYLTSFSDSQANGIFVGRYTYGSQPNYWRYNANAVLTWSRV